METQIYQPPALVGCGAGGLTKETMNSASTFAQEKTSSLTPFLKLGNSVPPCTSLEPLSHCPSMELSVREFVSR